MYTENDKADSESPAILPGLDAQTLAVITSMDAKGTKIATLDNIREITIRTYKKGNPVVVDEGQ